VGEKKKSKKDGLADQKTEEGEEDEFEGI